MADHPACWHAATGKHSRKAAGPVIASIERIDPRCAAKLPNAEHHRGGFQVALPQVVEQGCHGRIEHAHEPVMNRKVGRVAVEVAKGHLNRPHAHLHEPAGHQAAAAEVAVAVASKNLLRLVFDFKGGKVLGGHQRERIVHGFGVAGGGGVALAALAEGSRKELQASQPPGVARRFHIGPQVVDASAGARHTKGVKLLAEVAPAAGPLSVADRDIERHLQPSGDRFAIELIREDRADRRMLDRRIRPVAGFHKVGAPLVVALFADERPDQRNAIHPLSHQGKPRGNLQVGHAGRNRLGRSTDQAARMRIPRLKLARPAGHPERDQRSGPFRSPRGCGSCGEGWKTEGDRARGRARGCEAAKQAPARAGDARASAGRVRHVMAAAWKVWKVHCRLFQSTVKRVGQAREELGCLSVVPGKLRRVDQGPAEILRTLGCGEPRLRLAAGVAVIWGTSWRCLIPGRAEVGLLSRGWPPAEAEQEAVLHQLLVVERRQPDAAGRVEGIGLGGFADQLAVHPHQCLGHGAAAGEQFVVAGIAILAKKVVLADEAEEPRDQC